MRERRTGDSAGTRFKKSLNDSADPGFSAEAQLRQEVRRSTIPTWIGHLECEW